MNAAARALTQGNVFRGDLSTLSVSKKSGFIFFLWISVIASALGIIYLRHVERQLISELQIVTRHHHRVELERGQLLLEQSMWTSPSRIQQLAHERLGMNVAKPDALIVIKRLSGAVEEEEGGSSSPTVNHFAGEKQFAHPSERSQGEIEK